MNIYISTSTAVELNPGGPIGRRDVLLGTNHCEAAGSAQITIRHSGSAQASTATQMSDPTGSAQTDLGRDPVAAVGANFYVHHRPCVFQCSSKQWA